MPGEQNEETRGGGPIALSRPDQSRYRGALLGLACGDAVGTTVEFRRRGEFEPLKDMCGGGPFHLKAGQWTDDTSMALCLAESLLEKGTFDPADQMQRYVRWMEEGYLSSTGKCFDIGMTVGRALEDFKKSGDPFSGPVHPRTAGNGCLMRLVPVPMFCFPDMRKTLKLSGESSRTTHGADECLECSRLFGAMLHLALGGCDKEALLFSQDADGYHSSGVRSIARGDYRRKHEFDIRGSGYVVQSLEAALWCFWNTETFREAILMAANLGDDADTTAAICGQLAGAYYGEAAIPSDWRMRLSMREKIEALADGLFHHAERSFNSMF